MNNNYDSVLNKGIFALIEKHNDFLNDKTIITMADYLIDDFNTTLNNMPLILPFTNIQPNNYKVGEALLCDYIINKPIFLIKKQRIRKTIYIEKHFNCVINVKPEDLLCDYECFYNTYFNTIKKTFIEYIDEIIYPNKDNILFVIPPLDLYETPKDKYFMIINSKIAFKDTISLRMVDYIDLRTTKRYIGIDMLIGYSNI